MPMRYANQDAVLAHLRITDSDTADIERAVAIENGLAATFDGDIGFPFDIEPEPQTRTLRGGDAPELVIACGMRMLLTIHTGGTWDGTRWVDEIAVDPEMYHLTFVNRDGMAYGIRRLHGRWQGYIRITGIWGDQGVNEVPEDVREALTVATVKEYRRLTSSPQEMVGPEGMVIPTPSGLSDPHVKAAVERYRLVEVMS